MSENPGALKYSYDILSKLCGLISKFSKDFKYSFGEKIENYAIDTVAEISLTTKVFGFDEKIQHLSTTKKDIEIINVLLKVCHDSNKISHKDYDEINNDLNELFNQITKRESFCRTKLKEQSDLLK